MSENVLVTLQKIELSKKTKNISILEDNTKTFSRKPGISHPLTRALSQKNGHYTAGKA
jgi:hypothetical protein